MTCEKSCGAVVYTVADGEIKYLLVANMDGNWGFPKGHMEGMETETETALREVYEEAHLNIQLINGFRETDEYPLPQKPDCRKQVVYFLGTFQNQAVQCQPEEISESRLVCCRDAMQLLQFNRSREILAKADGYLATPTGACARRYSADSSKCVPHCAAEGSDFHRVSFTHHPIFDLKFGL